MGTVWFGLVAVMIAMYVLLDGFDLGAGAIHFLVGKTREERRQVLATIGPVWDGNEVWLLAAGGTLYFAFPELYASAFSGFYLPLMMVLWLLILRGLAIEFRNHVKSEVWTPLWDFLFSGASLLLVIFYGAALGNVVRGVPLDASGYFFEPLWTDWRLGPSTGILDWYTVMVGVVALMALILHGSLWVQLKTSGAVQERAGALAGRAWWAVVVLTVLVTVVTFRVQAQILSNFSRWPLGMDSAGVGGCRIGGNKGLAGAAAGDARVSGLLRVSGWHAYERGVRRISDGASRARCGTFLDGGQRGRTSLRTKDWVGVVDDRDAAGGGIFYDAVSIVCREGAGGRD